MEDRRLRRPALLVLGVAASVAAGQEIKKPNFSGNWRLNSEKSEMNSKKAEGLTLVIEQNAKSIHLSETGEDRKKTEFQCDTVGKECDGTFEGQPGKISLFYMGETLVRMETKGAGGDSVARKTMTLSADGKGIDVEISYIVPPGDKKDKLVFVKQP